MIDFILNMYGWLFDKTCSRAVVFHKIEIESNESVPEDEKKCK